MTIKHLVANRGMKKVRMDINYHPSEQSGHKKRMIIIDLPSRPIISTHLIYEVQSPQKMTDAVITDSLLSPVVPHSLPKPVRQSNFEIHSNERLRKTKTIQCEMV